jgi:uncharacterized radical SAM protein YgiQ
MSNGFLPISRQDMEERGITQFDFVFVIGDAYVDHPSFGPAIISRVLESYGYQVGIISQPNVKEDSSIAIYGQPRLGFLVSSGNMDSMVNHYSVSKKKREKDAYTPGGIMGKRPDYALKVYSKLIRKSFPDSPIILGGIEASLRRLAHYDYWADKLLPSVLLEAEADLLLYGMGERSIAEMAEALDSGIAVSDLIYLDGTVYMTKKKEDIYDGVFLPSYKDLKVDKTNYAKSMGIQYRNTDPFSGKRLAEEYEDGTFVVQNPTGKPLSQEEMDRAYALPYMRTYHPSYEELGGVPAIEEVKFSLTSNRGCFGGCNFCALTFHQGRIVQARSHESLIKEAEEVIESPDFKGYIHDVGGPTAEFRGPACAKQLKTGACINKQCMFPKLCESLDVTHKDYLNLLRKLRELPKVKKIFVRSGIRYDYLMGDKDKTFFKELCEHHISGQLKIAPEHISDVVLDKMGKPRAGVYHRFTREYKKWNEKLNKKQYLVPYLMSSHPGSGLKEAIELAEYLRDLGYMPQQVQDFYPTPSTISTCMYYTGLDPLTMKSVYVAKNPHEKAMQRALIQYRNPKNYRLVEEALILAGRRDLIGFGKNCLIRPRREAQKKGYGVSSEQGYQGKKKQEVPKRKKKTIRNIHKKKV